MMKVMSTSRVSIASGTTSNMAAMTLKLNELMKKRRSMVYAPQDNSHAFSISSINFSMLYRNRNKPIPIFQSMVFTY